MGTKEFVSGCNEQAFRKEKTNTGGRTLLYRHLTTAASSNQLNMKRTQITPTVVHVHLKKKLYILRIRRNLLVFVRS